MSDDEILEKLLGLLEKYNSKKIKLSAQTEVSADLGMDSVTVMDFIMETEDLFEIDIVVAELSETENVGDLVAIVQKGLNRSEHDRFRLNQSES